MNIEETILRSIEDEFKHRNLKQLNHFTVEYHSDTEAQWQINCIAVGHPWGFDAHSRHRRYLKIIVDDDKVIITNKGTPIRRPITSDNRYNDDLILGIYELANPAFCIGAIYNRIIEILQEQNKIVFQGPA
jgi:hypothetical protein